MPQARKKLVVLIALAAAAGGLAVAGRMTAETASSAAPAVPGDGAAADKAAATSQAGEPPAVTINGWTNEPVGTNLYVRMMLTVLLVLALGIPAIYLSRKLLPKIGNLPGKEVRVLETAHLGPRKQIHLVAAGQHRLLLASTNENITMLADVTDVPDNFPAVLEHSS